MKILPPVTSPPKKKHVRRHRPLQGEGERSYLRFRECLRWDFGFTCAFCLLHEQDVVINDRWGIWSTEHREPKSSDPTRINDYTNCYWCCRRCNDARNDRPVDHPDGLLLDPCHDCWPDRFSWEDLSLLPRAAKSEDRDAHRTCEVYDLGDPLKVELKAERSEAVTWAWANLGIIDKIVPALAPNHPDFDDIVEDLRNTRRRALRTLRRYCAIPATRAVPCHCEAENGAQLPLWLNQQCQELAAEVSDHGTRAGSG